MVTLEWDYVIHPSNYLCSGVLISPKFVLAAAHCVYMDGVPPKYVKIGERPQINETEDIKIERIFVHPGYKQHAVYNDIAIIKLKEDSL